MSASGSTPVLTKPTGTATGPGGVGGGRVRRTLDRARTPLRGLAGLAGLVVLLEVLPHTGVVSADYLPPASEMGRALWQLLGEDAFWTALGDTLTGWGLGLAIAVVGRGGRRRRDRIGPGAAGGDRLDDRVPAPHPVGGPHPAGRPALRHRPASRRCCWSSTPPSGRCSSRCCTACRTSTRSPRTPPAATGWAAGRGCGTSLWPTALPYVMTGVRLAATVALDPRRSPPNSSSARPGSARRSRSPRPPAPFRGSTPWSWSPDSSGSSSTSLARAVERRALPGTLDAQGGDRDDRPRLARRVRAGPRPARVAVHRVVVRHRRQHRLLRAPAVAPSWAGLRRTCGRPNGCCRDVLPSLVRLLAGYRLAVVLGVGLGLVDRHAPWRARRTGAGSGVLPRHPAAGARAVIMLFAGIGDTMKVLSSSPAASGRSCSTPSKASGPSTKCSATPAAPTASPARRGCGTWCCARPARRSSPACARPCPSRIILMVISEMFAASNGLGFTIVQFQRTFAIPEMWSGIMLLGLLGFALSLLFRVVETPGPGLVPRPAAGPSATPDKETPCSTYAACRRSTTGRGRSVEALREPHIHRSAPANWSASSARPAAARPRC